MCRCLLRCLVFPVWCCGLCDVPLVLYVVSGGVTWLYLLCCAVQCGVVRLVVVCRVVCAVLCVAGEIDLVLRLVVCRVVLCGSSVVRCVMCSCAVWSCGVWCVSV